MTPELKAQLDALPLGYPIRATVDNGGRFETKNLVRENYGAGCWYAMGGGYYIADSLSSVVIPDVTWPPDPLPSVPGTVIVGTVTPDSGGDVVADAVLMVSDRADGVLYAPVHIDGSRYVRPDEVTDWRVVYAPGGAS